MAAWIRNCRNRIAVVALMWQLSMLWWLRSGVVSWVVVTMGALTAMHVVGLNLQPLLTVGGVSGIIVGLSAQTIMSNMLSGINLVSRFY